MSTCEYEFGRRLGVLGVEANVRSEANGLFSMLGRQVEISLVRILIVLSAVRLIYDQWYIHAWN